ncbi:MAG TPA: DUF2911 domain-containing protein [Vicinamibacterales bacterium]|nr:DUF2911 domain-containing protein [Vicinamibacterales bacterium]
MRSRFLFSAVLMAAALGMTVSAQKRTEVHPGKGGSPHVRTAWMIDGANISVEYGRPALKGREEGKLMPMGRVWRLGADEQTTLVTDKPLTFGALSVPAGTYGLHALVDANWQLVISKRDKGWGVPYPEGQDLGRAPMKAGKTAKPVEMLTISIDDTATGGVLRVEWGNTSASVPFTVG